jgi:ATP-binding cassette, sub-family E, member 1
MQRLALAITLGKDADIYLIDEPSAFLDSDQRVKVAKMLKRFMNNRRKSAFIVEHDFIMATYLADQYYILLT